MQIVMDEMAAELPPELDPEARLVLDRNQFVEKIVNFKPNSSKKESRELYIIGKNIIN